MLLDELSVVVHAVDATGLDQHRRLENCAFGTSFGARFSAAARRSRTGEATVIVVRAGYFDLLARLARVTANIFNEVQGVGSAKAGWLVPLNGKLPASFAASIRARADVGHFLASVDLLMGEGRAPFVPESPGDVSRLGTAGGLLRIAIRYTLAHEASHVILGHTAASASTTQQELDADRMAGVLLRASLTTSHNRPDSLDAGAEFALAAATFCDRVWRRYEGDLAPSRPRDGYPSEQERRDAVSDCRMTERALYCLLVDCLWELVQTKE